MKTTRMLAILVLALGLAAACLAKEGTWTTRSPMSTATSFHSASVVDGKIYVIGGTDNLIGWADYWSTMLMYDPATDTWTKKADMPTARARLSTSVVDGRIYAIGGSPHRDADVAAVEVYDPATDTWTKKADMPRARNWLSTSVVNGKIYAVGGKIYPSEAMVSTVEEYDPTTDTWTRKADMPGLRGIHSAGVVDGKIYVIGGVTGTWGPFVSTVEAYDPTTDTWTKKADMPTARASHSASVVDGKICAIGGAPGWVPAVSTVEVYDPATDTWTEGADMPTARGSHSASVVDGKIYAIGGFLNPSTWVSTAAVEVYDPNPLVVDFNVDEKVDFKDFCMLAQYWYQDQSPFVKRRVDYEYLAVLAEHWLADYRLIAHWKLDETEGTIAHDSFSDKDGTLYGQPLWQPAAGKIDGALQLDGIDDYISIGFPFGPADLSFSIFVWVKGGALGQVIISQMNYIVGRTTQPGCTWLGTDSSDGRLITRLMDVPYGPLESELVITDGQWHHIGLVYDFNVFCRLLYVDGTEVAKDETIVAGLLSAGSLRFGADKDLSASSFFSGLIDDIRIYNQALSAEEIEELAR